jgi:hypothetical protein
MVMEVPPGVLGPVDDADFRWVNDMGLTVPDADEGEGEGEGGKYLFAPPGFKGDLPKEGYFTQTPRANTWWYPTAPSQWTAMRRRRWMG